MPRQWSNGWISLLRTSPDPNTKCCGIGYGFCQLWCCHLWIGCALVPWSHSSRSEKPFNLSPRSIVATQAPRDLSHEVPNHMISAWTQKSIAANWHWKNAVKSLGMSWPWKALPCAPWNIYVPTPAGPKQQMGKKMLRVQIQTWNWQFGVLCAPHASRSYGLDISAPFGLMLWHGCHYGLLLIAVLPPVKWRNWNLKRFQIRLERWQVQTRMYHKLETLKASWGLFSFSALGSPDSANLR